jgi:hypothetical protein
MIYEDCRRALHIFAEAQLTMTPRSHQPAPRGSIAGLPGTQVGRLRKSPLRGPRDQGGNVAPAQGLARYKSPLSFISNMMYSIAQEVAL